jgi:hypothetical protein
MIKVYWDTDGNEITSENTEFNEDDWYDYEIQTGNTESGGTSKWANVIMQDGSYFVWIPRFAYKIRYFNDAEKTNFAYEGYQITGANTRYTLYGDVEILFLDGTSNNYIDEETGEVLPLPPLFQVHPVFTTDTGFGGWSSQISGFWIAKYETSKSSSNLPQSKPNASSWASIKLGSAFSTSKSYNTGLNSHLIKNSEWAATALLAHSKYGRNATEVTPNSNGRTTGYAGSGSPYNSAAGQLASTTGNIYGVYDMSGGVSEFIATFFKNIGFIPNISGFKTNSAALIYVNGSSGTMYSSSTPFVTIYGIYNSGGSYMGDAMGECNGWNGDLNSMLGSTGPGLVRGGNYSDGSEAGLFMFCYHITGTSGTNDGFRMALTF